MLGGQEIGFILVVLMLLIIGSKGRDLAAGLWRKNAPNKPVLTVSQNPGNRAEDF